MSKIDYQVLREAAVAIETVATPQKLLAFRMKVTPQVVLELLDERERNQQYIKRRDQENEEIALMVGKLRVDLEAAENNLIDSECHVAELEEALRDKQALLEASEKRIAELEAEPVSQTYKLNKLAGNSPVIPGEVLSAILKVSKIRADFDDFDGDRRGIGDCLDEAEQELIVTINKHASQLAAGPIAPNDVREQTAIPQVPVIPDGWISCSERIPAQDDWVLIYSKHGEYMAGQVQGEYVELSDGTLSWLGNALFWTPLPEPPQEVSHG